VPLDAAAVSVTIRAVSGPNGTDGSGTVGNLQAGDIVELANPLPNVASKATVVSQTVTAADAESVDRYRQRILDRFQRRPQGGAYADYQAWGEEVNGIVNIYPYASDTPGEIDVYVEATEESSGSADGIPTSAQLEAVAEAIDLNESGRATRRPVSAAVNVLPITRSAYVLQISGLQPDTTETRDAIEDGVDEHLRSREPFIEGLSVLPRADRVTEAAVGGIVETIVNAKGATVTTVSLTPGPASVLPHGGKAKLTRPATFL
jgi:uncharacterized phage protein gp47/JayE